MLSSGIATLYPLSLQKTLILRRAPSYYSCTVSVFVSHPWYYTFLNDVHNVFTDKETYEPVIERIFELQNASNQGPDIVEAWSSDAPNHGLDSSVNETKLLEFPNGVSE